MSELWGQVNYTADIDYLIGSFIREYDISKANINILLWKGLISIEQYNFLYNADRMTRQVTIGKMRAANPALGEALDAGVIEVKKLFFEANNIQDYEVLAIKNDAIYLINKIPTVTKFDNVEFTCRNIYSSYLRIFKIQYLYYFDPMTRKEVLDIKGIGEQQIALHQNYFYEFLLEVLNVSTVDSIENVLWLIQAFTGKYVSFNLDIGYYREFNPASQYRIQGGLHYMDILADHLPEKDKVCLNISYNHNILRELYKIFSQIYFNKR